MDGMEDYFRASLDLLDSSVRRELFQSDRPIRTKAHDTPPALYAPGSAVKNSVMTAGSIIEGSVENSVCFRNVRIEKGAVVKNCVLMEKCVVKAGARGSKMSCAIKSSPFPRTRSSAARRSIPACWRKAALYEGKAARSLCRV